jgi:type IV secretion system protein VirB11
MENVLSLRTSDHVPMDRLLRHCLRQRPDRITVGEVRDGAALTLCKAWTTGHPGGASTVHSNVNDPRGALRRVEMLVAEAYQGPARELIAEAIDLIVLVARGKDGVRRVEGLARVANDLDNGQYRIDWEPAEWPEGIAA